MSFENARIVKKQASGDEYRKQTAKRGDPAYVVSRSDLVEISRCPHKWLVGTDDDDSTGATEWGTLIDAMLLGGEHLITVTPETYDDDKGNKKPWNWNAGTCRKWREQQQGRIIVKPDMFAEVETAIKLIRDDTLIASVLSPADYQVWAQADWKINAKLSIPVRVLIDIVSTADGSVILADLKTTKSAGVRDYARAIYNFGYHVQAALYLDLWNAATGQKRNTFLHIIQESDKPYEVGRRILDNNWIAMGRAQYRAAIELYGRCLESNEWPSYDDMTGPSIESIGGWTLTSPEPWMIMNSGVPVDNREGILG